MTLGTGVRATAIALAGVAAASLGVRALDPGTRPPAEFAGLLTWGATWLLCAAAVWLAMIVVVTALEAVGQGRRGLATRGTAHRIGRGVGRPEAVRRLVLALCGVAVAGSTALPPVLPPAAATYAATPGSHPAPASTVHRHREATPRRTTSETRTAASAAATPSATATLPSPAPPAGAATSPDAARRGAETRVVVREGDSLWAVARRALPPHTDDAGLAAYVARLHALNRATIGPDPDHILPGQVLRLPAPTVSPALSLSEEGSSR